MGKREATKRTSERPTARWFSVQLLFCSRVGDTPSLRPLCEEQVVLFKGTTESQVRASATVYARREEHGYKNMYGERVDWRFVRIERLDEIDRAITETGWEVASRLTRRTIRSLKKETSRKGVRR